MSNHKFKIGNKVGFIQKVGNFSLTKIYRINDIVEDEDGLFVILEGHDCELVCSKVLTLMEDK